MSISNPQGKPAPAEVTAWFARNVEAEFDKLDARTGRFMEGEGWAVTNQDIMLSMAVLYLNQAPGNPLYRDAALLERIGRAGDALRSFQYPDGKVEFVKTDGSKWGPIYMPWSMYHWLETFKLLGPELGEERLSRWREGLLLAFDGIHREMRELLDGGKPRESIVHNIPTWNAMGLHRASGVFGRTQWRETADAMIRLAVDAQDEEGFWPEHHGPTTLYNLVYIHALGLYRRHGGAVDVMPVLEKALRFHERFTYPDGSRVETVDGRTKYDSQPSPMGLVGFTLLPRGEAYARSVIALAMSRDARWRAPHMADLLQYWNMGSGESEPRDEASSTLFDRPVLEERWASSLVVKRDDWYVCLSAFAAPRVESRWGQDRQSFVGVWHAGSGLIVGGGNSKNQPEWSTFELRTADGGHYYVPDGGTVDAANRQIRLACGPRTLTVRLSALDADCAALDFSADIAAGDEGVVHVPLRLKLGELLSVEGAESEPALPVAERSVRLERTEGVHRIGHAGWQLELEGAYRLDWPSYPFNPYAEDGAAKLVEAVAVLTVPLAAGETRRLLFRCRPCKR
ncbi:hypothetical protein [Paenibacillus flagellatus]|uniref:Heparin-sulfate lyase N-terminal domain-containing protein n=1 Tax=Paenibacillus flagellatus TaxID=2211139 RepID=A0A2V5KRB1_9BACL|nr:hypothetical protein [Paenibacillus flagellatus]PYI51366.1 hypothetical protein DLM86_25410 [Paenibacillus flagellatus]